MAARQHGGAWCRDGGGCARGDDRAGGTAGRAVPPAAVVAGVDLGAWRAAGPVPGRTGRLPGLEGTACSGAPAPARAARPMPPYVRRPHDDLLDAVLPTRSARRGRLVVVRGGSSTGRAVEDDRRLAALMTARRGARSATVTLSRTRPLVTVGCDGARWGCDWQQNTSEFSYRTDATNHHIAQFVTRGNDADAEPMETLRCVTTSLLPYASRVERAGQERYSWATTARGLGGADSGRPSSRSRSAIEFLSQVAVIDAWFSMRCPRHSSMGASGREQ